MPEPTRLAPHEIANFLRRFRFAGGRLRRVRLRTPKGKTVGVELHVTASEAGKPVRLVLRLDGVEEYRFQMRPGQPKVRIADARIGYLNGLFFVNLDAWGLEPGEQPKLHDYRASEVYAGGRELFWHAVPPKAPPPATA